jgi:hypothetical protein
MKTPGERAEALFRLSRSCPSAGTDYVDIVFHDRVIARDVSRDGACLIVGALSHAVASAIREHEDDLLRFGARACPVKPDRRRKALARLRERLPFTSAEVEAVIRHLEAQVALLAHEQDYRQGYDEGRREGWRACREAVLACLSRRCASHARPVMKRLVETEVPKECP